MRTTSTGTGLIVLSATIATCFFISQFGNEAAASSTTSNTQGNQRASAPSSALAARLADDTCEVTSDGLGWFNPTLHLWGCNSNWMTGTEGRLGASPLGAADVDGDGKIEYFEVEVLGPNSTISDLGEPPIVINNQGVDGGNGLMVSQTQVVDGEVNQTRTSICPLPPQMGDSLIALGLGYNLTRVKIKFVGWRDMDGDGDLDLVVALKIYSGNYSGYIGFDAWLENIRHQSPPKPNPYDLDHDGHVTTSDLSLLLLEFTD